MANIKLNSRKVASAGKFVDTKHVETVRNNYKSERWADNSARLGKEDSLSVWYSAEELENFLSVIREQGGDGVRMYFGVYGKENSSQPLYAGRQTIVMVATKMTDSKGLQNHKDLYVQQESGAAIVAYNSGKICPPFCGDLGGGFQDLEIYDKHEVVVK